MEIKIVSTKDHLGERLSAPVASVGSDKKSEVLISPIEGNMLMKLCCNPNRTVTSGELFSAGWPEFESEEITEYAHYIRLYINYLREKLGLKG